MNREYKIGAYVFQTYEEYSDGLDDVNTIRYIVDNVDMDDMDVLLHLYDWMKQEKLVFKSDRRGIFCRYCGAGCDAVPAAVRCREKNRGQKRDDRQTSEIRRDHLCHSRSNLFCNLLRNRI